VVKGEKKNHRWAGSNFDLGFDVNSQSLEYIEVEIESHRNIRAIGYLDNEDDWLRR
jgi:hypothetical protein